MADAARPSVAVLGAGAVGCYYGAMLARSGLPVTLIGRTALVDAVRRDGLVVEEPDGEWRIDLAAAEDASAARGADLVLVCVKSFDTAAAARSLAPHLGSGARVLSFQNGVDNVERMRAEAGIDAFPVVVYVAAEMAGPGRVRHTGGGGLVIGDLAAADDAGGARAAEIAAIAGRFERAGVSCGISADIAADLWRKLVVNCAYNAPSALGRARYQRLVGHAGGREIMRGAIGEAVAVGRAAGIVLPDPGGLADSILGIAKTMPGQASSTAQDIARGRRTEIDSLNGHVVRLGATLRIPTPVNATLHALVKLLEEAPPGQA